MISLNEYLDSLGDRLAAFENTETVFRIGLAESYRPALYIRVQMTRVAHSETGGIVITTFCEAVAVGREGDVLKQSHVSTLARPDAFRDACMRMLAGLIELKRSPSFQLEAMH